MGCECSKSKPEQKLIQDAINKSNICREKQTKESYTDEEDSIDCQFSDALSDTEQFIACENDQIIKPDYIHKSYLQPADDTNYKKEVEELSKTTNIDNNNLHEMQSIQQTDDDIEINEELIPIENNIKTNNIHINQHEIGEKSSPLRMTDMKSTLSTRNSYTGRSIDILSVKHRNDLFNSDLNYISWEQKYIQKRFHPKQYLQQIRQHRREILEKQKINSADSFRDYNEILNQEEKRDIELQQRFNTFVEKHNGEKPVLVLDVDNTMIYVRFFSDEMKVGDIVTYFESEYVSKNNGKVIELRLTLSLMINDNRLIDINGSETIECEYWTDNNDDLKKYKKNSIFEYKLEGADQLVECKIHKVEVTGCKIATVLGENNNIHVVDFTVADGSGNLEKLEPMIERTGMVPVHFIYEGFLVRLRPNLDEFLEYISDDFDVVIYTSAYKKVYEGLLQRLHEYICEQLGRKDETDLYLWSDILYRDDCTLNYTENNKPYHHKDLTLFGCDLSRLIMIDNSPIVCHGQEPNFILIKDYFGKNQSDDELMGKIYQILHPIVEMEGDIRYHLCGLNMDYENMDSIFDIICNEHSCLLLTNTLMQKLDVFCNKKQVTIQVTDEPIKNGIKKKEPFVILDGYHDASESILSSSTNSEIIEYDEEEEVRPTFHKSQSERTSSNDMIPIDFKRNKSLLSANSKERVRRHSRFSSMGTYIYGVHVTSLYSHDVDDYSDNEEEHQNAIEFNHLYNMHRSKSTSKLSDDDDEKESNYPLLFTSKSLNIQHTKSLKLKKRVF